MSFTAKSILEQLKPLGIDSYKKTMHRHGVPEPLYGVKIEELKKFQKKIKKDYQLALDLYDTGIYDAMYLAGLIADETQMTKQDLKRWLSGATCFAISGTAVAWVSAESKHGRELALSWIDAKKEITATTGWDTLSGLVAIRDDQELDVSELEQLVRRIGCTIHEQPNRVRYSMNGFVISAGSYVKALTKLAIETAESMGEVTVDMGDTACKVPAAADYIRKIQQRGTIGKKRKSVRC